MNTRNTRPPPDEDGSYQGPERRTRSRTDDDAIERLEQIVHGMPQFSAEEQALVRQVLEAYRGWQVLGKAAKMLIVTLAGLSALVVGLGHLKAVLRGWLT
jgi:hypothetical protein